MHALLELLPLIGLAGGYLLGKSINPGEAMYYLSYGAIIGTILQFLWYKVKRVPMQKTTLITGLMLVLFATITIVLRNDLFIKLKPTVLSWGFAVFFWGYAYIKKASILERMMGEQFELPAQKWFTLNWAWVVFNFLVGLGNGFVVWQITKKAWTDDSWVNFKLALLPITLVFVVGQTVYLFKNGTQKTDKNTEKM